MSAHPRPPTTSGPPKKMWSRIVSGEAKKSEAKEESEAKGDDKSTKDGSVWPEIAPGSLISGIDEGYH